VKVKAFIGVEGTLVHVTVTLLTSFRVVRAPLKVIVCLKNSEWLEIAPDICSGRISGFLKYSPWKIPPKYQGKYLCLSVWTNNHYPTP